MQLLHKQLGIHSIRTSPYHPQTDGLVERFNQTLKRMLRKFVSDNGKDWDKWLPFLLYAYREVPQASTGFSPFELLYGWQVQGPLDLVKRSWEASSTTAEGETNIVKFVLQMRDRLEKYREQAQENLEEAQKNQKLWYDKWSRRREYQPGQKVLLLLPSSTNKLLAKWQGPYEITKKKGPVTYEVFHPDKGKKNQTYHVNLLKEWREQGPELKKGMLACKVETPEAEDDDKVDFETPEHLQSAVSLEHLQERQRVELTEVLNTYPELQRGRPGRTNLVEHKICLTEATPIRQRPYRVPESLIKPLKEELKMMLEMDIIEPSTSAWSSPIVIVPKKDGTLRVCLDFRKLNAVSKFDAYPMPRIDELVERIGRAKYITTLDLCKGYWQVPLEKTSREYTAFRTPVGLYHFKTMPFGLHGAPATFQRLMNQVLRNCEEYSAAYLDDVVIYSTTWTDHVHHLHTILQKIQRAGLTLNVAKCEWARQETRYLGFQLGNGEIRPQVVSEVGWPVVEK